MLRFVAISATLMAVLLSSWAAHAQSLVITENQIAREPNGLRDSTERPYDISYSDCINNDYFIFPTTLTNVPAGALEVWVSSPGVDCTDDEVRNQGTQCFQVHTEAINDDQIELEIFVRDIIAQHRELSLTGEAICDDDSITVAEEITLTFMVVSSGSVDASVTFQTSYDLIGPSAPTDVRSGVGEEQLTVKWTPPNDQDLARYVFYCDPAPGEEEGTTTPASRPLGPPPAGGAAGTAGTAGVGGTSTGGTAGVGGSTGGTAGTAGAAGSGGTTTAGSGGAATGGVAGSAGALNVAGTSGSSAGGTTATGGSSSSNSECPSTVLVAGERPSADMVPCGSVTGQTATEGTIKRLENGTTYAVAVSAVDDLGNPGPLSELTCATPQEVDDFFEVYSRAGGKGGGGFCSLSGASAPGFAVGLGIAGLLLWRRRRQRGAAR